MIKTLKKKFVITAMTAITVLLLFLLGSINAVNVISNEKQTSDILDRLGRSNAYEFFGFSDERGFFSGFFTPPVTADTEHSAVYFTANIYPNGLITNLDLSHIYALSSSEAAELVARAYEDGSLSGRIGNYKYKGAVNSDGRSVSYIFLETATQRYSVMRIAFLTALGGAICWLMMLVLVVFLSKKAIAPIAANIEKQKRFVTDAGHEIKTPLAIILANTEAMELHNGENKWSRNIRSQVLRLNGLMQNLLTLAKTDESVNIEMEELDFSQILMNTAEMFREPAQVRGIDIRFSVPGEVKLCANREYVSNLVSILMDNAVKYSNENSDIFVSLVQGEKSVAFSVTNTCENLPDCEPDKLFDRFYRADRARTQENGGYGIGLSAAKAIAELHGGSIKAEYPERNVIKFTVRI